MKLSQICAIALLVFAASTLALADGVHDPRVIVHGAGGGGDNVQCGKHNCQDVGLNFSFTTPKSGSGALYFTNTSGQNWTSLELVETGVPAADITCTENLFLSCVVKTLKNGAVEILMSGIKSKALWNAQGILNGQSFSIQFACSGGCWPGGLTFNGHAGTGISKTPEPGTIALMVTGLGAMFSRRKLWKKRLNS